MNTMRVRWEIDVDAKSPRDAARKALRIQRDPESIATVFDIRHAGKWFVADLSGVERVRICRVGPRRP